MSGANLLDVFETSALWVGMWFTFWPQGHRPVPNGWHPWSE
jgi:hypothetical protein